MSDTYEVKRGSLGFTIVTNSVVKDERLSWQAKGLYTYLVSNTVDWKIFKKEIENHATNGRESTANAWKELVKYGWITSEARQESGKMAGWHHTIHCDLGRERPNRDSPTNGKPVRRENRKTVNPQLISNNNKKDQLNKRNVSDETEFESFWSTIRQKYREHGHTTVGNKEPARKAYKKALKATNHNSLKDHLCSLIDHKAIIKSKGLFTPTPPHVSTWLNNKGWTEELEPITNNNSFKTPLSSAQIPQKKRKAFGQ